MPDNDSVIDIRDLSKSYGDITALGGVTLSLERGRILGLIGPNGAGKTTMIKILVGQLRPTAGSATIDGVDCVRESKKIKRLVGYMPDVFGSYDNMRVREYLDFFGAAFKIPRRKRIERIDEVLETTATDRWQDRYVESLSHGMKQRVAIARTLLHDPQVLFLDEPANGLDPQARIEMRELLLRLADMGKTLLVTSHILPELSRICHQIAIITHGKLRAFGTLDEVMKMVSERRWIEVQVVSPQSLEKAADAIRGRVEPDADISTSAAESVVRFRTSKPESEMAGLLTHLVESGIEVSQFREVAADLEETFLSITHEANAENERTEEVRAEQESPAP